MFILCFSHTETVTGTKIATECTAYLSSPAWGQALLVCDCGYAFIFIEKLWAISKHNEEVYLRLLVYIKSLIYV